MFTYAFLGLCAATAGARLVNVGSGTVWAQSGFAILAGLMLILQGLHAAGWLRWRVRRKSNSPCLTNTFFAQFLKGGSLSGAFVAGVLTGFLPCGLVYSFLALAASSASLPAGLAIMLAFGAGTVPVMLVTGTGFSMATVRIRQQLMRVAALCVLVTGLMTMGRGIAFASANSAESGAVMEVCPFCPPEVTTAR